MPQKFVNDEDGYLAWVQAHPDGYIVNMDDPPATPHYPIVHAASHKSLSTAARTNYTTGRYFKVCSEQLEELEGWALKNYGRALTHCGTCLKV